METQQASSNVSMISQMNAFYGNPNLSQESTAAIFRGAQPPEVFTPEPPEAQSPEATTPETETSSPVESFFSQATERLEISPEAAAMQQEGAETPENPPATEANEDLVPAAGREDGPQQNNPTELAGSGQQPSNNEPIAVSALNEDSAPEPLTSVNSPQTENNPLQQSYEQFGSGPAASNASQPGAIFSALV